MKNDLEIYFNTANLQLSWERMVRSNGRDVKDFFGIEVFSKNINLNIQALSKSIISGEYKPSRHFKYYEPKASRTHRTKTILCVEDALVYQAIANKIAEQHFEKLTSFNDAVFGSVLHPEVVLGENLLNAQSPEYYFFDYYVPLYNRFVNSVNKEIEDSEIRFKLETDITGFFDSIPHSKLLMVLLKKFDTPKPVLELLGNSFTIWSGTRDSITPGVGIPQGPAASFFFANALLSDLDHLITKNGYTYYRYMDDIRIYEESEEQLGNALILIDNYLKGNGLSLNTKKTSIEEISSDRQKEKVHLLSTYDNDDDDDLSETEGKKRSFELRKVIGDQNNEDFTDTNQQYTFQTLTDDDVITFCRTEVKVVETTILERLKELNIDPINFDSILKDDDFKKEIIHLAFRWRSSLNILRSLKQEVLLSDTLIPIWLFGVEHLFWKANHFCWNLNQYGANDLIKKELLKISKQFKNVEWVRYQILSNMALVQIYTASELKEIFRQMKEEASELVRLGYYKLLLLHVKKDAKLLTAVNNSIIEEMNPYLKQMVAISQAKKNGITDLGIITNWIGL